MAMFRSPLSKVAIAVLALVDLPLVLCGSYAIPYFPATYDYVVIGGGTSGLTIASRLAANPSISVAVVEAGGIYELDNPTEVIPGFAGLQSTGSDANDTNPLIDWDFVTTPQPVRGIRFYWDTY
jgi:choline dehydrogenase-like flavoprotein